MTSDPLNLVMLMPVFNDWESADLLCRKLDAQMAQDRTVSARILLVDDGSTEPVPDDFLRPPLSGASGVQILRLVRNLGHQRAIAVGLTYVNEALDPDAIVVMDSDGEDRP